MGIASPGSSSAVKASPPAHAGVRFPPPFVYIAGILLGWLIARVWPLPITRTPDASTARLVAAPLLAVGYLAVFLGALAAFRRAHTTLVPNRPATSFVVDGPYRWTRNPMYLSLTLLYLAVALWMNNWWAVVLIIPVLFFIRTAVIAREERYLSSAFPEEYAAYRARVRRWL